MYFLISYTYSISIYSLFHSISTVEKYFIQNQPQPHSCSYFDRTSLNLERCRQVNGYLKLDFKLICGFQEIQWSCHLMVKWVSGKS